MKSPLPFLILLAFGSSIPQGMEAQSIAGQVVDSTTGTPVGTGFVVVLDEDGNELARVLSDGRGRFSITNLTPGQTVTLRSERIGFRVATVRAVVEAVPVSIIIRITSLPVQLANIEVEERSSCAIQSSETDGTSVVWEEARKALSGAAWSADQPIFRFENVRFQRVLDATRRRVIQETSRTLRGLYRTPFESRDAELLATTGYVERDGTDLLYHAPDAHVLQTESFLGTHCFELVRDEKERPDMVGLAFEPIPGRRMPDIKGALWLDQMTSELRTLEYHYVHHPDGLEDARAGGTVDFLRLENGAWVVRRWEIRSPELIRRGANTRLLGDVDVGGFRDQGGEILTIENLEGVRLYHAPVATVTGIVTDSSGAVPRPLGGAIVFVRGTDYQDTTDLTGSFSLAVPLNASYEIAFEHAAFDSLGYVVPGVEHRFRRDGVDTVSLNVPPIQAIISHHCGNQQHATGESIIVGTVFDGATRRPFSNAAVRAAWQNLEAIAAGQFANLEVTAYTDRAGRYVMCGLETGRPISIYAGRGTKSSRPLRILFEPGVVTVDTSTYHRPTPIWQHDITIDAAGPAPITGLVLDGVTGRPIEGARVMVGNEVRSTTDLRGGFDITLAESGEVTVTVLHQAYRPLEVVFPLAGHAPIVAHLSMEPLTSS